MGRRRGGGGGDAKAAAGQLAEASSQAAGRDWASMDDEAREPWIQAWRPVTVALRNRRELPLEAEEVAAIVRTQRRLEPDVDGPPGPGGKEAAQLVMGLRMRQR